MHGPNDTVVADFDPSCVEPDEPHLLAGRYRLEGLLGRGGMGSVYAAHDIELDERVAVKLLAADTSDETAAVRLRAEVRIARKVTHPNVARTYDLGIHDGRRFLTMELVDGPSLRGLVHTRTLTWRERLSIVEQVASGLAAIHACGVLHRDLKPENVLVSSAGTAKITDFGIALTADSGPRSTAGTPRYMAPELLVGGQPTFASDVYALGLVAYDVLAERTAPGRGVDPLALSPDARPVVERCLLDDPTRRPTALDVVQAVGALRSEPAPATIAVPRQARTPMRVGVSAFVADAGGDAYLGTSLAADVLRVLVVAPELEVAAFILPSTDPVREARRARLGAVVCGSVRRVGGEVTVTVRLVAVDDALQIWARRFTVPFERVLAELEAAVAALTKALAVHERPAAARPPADANALELYLRASEAEHRPWRDWETDAPDFFRRALEHAPDDPVLLAGLALSLLRGAPPFTSARYLEAREAGDRALLGGMRTAGAQLACGASLFMSNDGVSAVEALRRALSMAPSLPDAHAMLGSIAGQVGLLDEAIAHARLALALLPSLAIARLVGATALEMKGDLAACDAMLHEGMTDPASFGLFLCAISAARFALWRGSSAELEKAAARIRPFAAHPLLAPLLDLLEGRGAVDPVLLTLMPLRTAAGEWARQRTMGLQMEAELHLWAGDHDAAIASVGGMIETGTFEAAWFEACPLLARVAESAVVRRAREDALARSVAVREAVWSLHRGTAR